MCGGNVGPGYNDSLDEQARKTASARASGYAQQRGLWEKQWDLLPEEERQRYGGDKAKWVAEATKNSSSTYEAYSKQQQGDEYIDPKTGRAVGAPPLAPDLTDAAITKARTSALFRLQTGKNRSNSFATQGVLGSFDVSKPVLGGY